MIILLDLGLALATAAVFYCVVRMLSLPWDGRDY
jgi:hypothetical protein